MRRLTMIIFFLWLASSVSARTRVWLVHSSHTGGHRAAAQALARALNELPDVETEVINTMDYLPASLKLLQKTAFAILTKTMPALKRKAFESSIEGQETAKQQAIRWLGVKAFFSRSFRNRIADEQPDIIVSTHSQTNVMLGIWKKHGHCPAPLHCVVTDYNTHAMWSHPFVDHYYVATNFVKDRLVYYGTESQRISVTGIPVNPSFARIPLVDTARAKSLLNLSPGVPTITMLGGSLGYGPYRSVIDTLEEQGRTVQFLAMCGKNDDLRRELDTLADQLRSVRLYTYGFVDRFYRFMDAADAVITKPGGLTVTELLCRRKAMIFIKPALGLEQHVAGAIEKLGVAAIEPSPPAGALRAFVEATTPARQAERLAAIDDIVKTEAVFDIARQISEAARRMSTIEGEQ